MQYVCHDLDALTGNYGSGRIRGQFGHECESSAFSQLTLLHSLTQQLSGTSKLSRLTFLIRRVHHLIVNFSKHHHFVTGNNCEYLGEYLEIIFSSSTYCFYVTTLIWQLHLQVGVLLKLCIEVMLLLAHWLGVVGWWECRGVDYCLPKCQLW